MKMRTHVVSHEGFPEMACRGENQPWVGRDSALETRQPSLTRLTCFPQIH